MTLAVLIISLVTLLLAGVLLAYVISMKRKMALAAGRMGEETKREARLAAVQPMLAFVWTGRIQDPATGQGAVQITISNQGTGNALKAQVMLTHPECQFSCMQAEFIRVAEEEPHLFQVVNGKMPEQRGCVIEATYQSIYLQRYRSRLEFAPTGNKFELSRWNMERGDWEIISE